MTGKAVVVPKNHINTTNNILNAEDIVSGKIALTEIVEPYLFIYDEYDVSLNNAEEQEDPLAKAVNIILTKKMGYRVVDPCYIGIISDRVVCMVK